MKIIVMSDSHRRSGIIDQVMSAHPDADAFIHCGDIQEEPNFYPGLKVVAGNGDYDPRLPKQLCFTLNGHEIFVTHSHLFPYMNKHQHLAKKAKEYGCDIVLYGHTHIPAYEVVNGVTILNPGSLLRNRDGSAPSYAILTLNHEIKVQFVHLEW